MNFEQISQTREKFEDEQKIRAKERNKYRTLGQKLFLKDKFSGIDMAVEEAIKMDDEAKKLINRIVIEPNLENITQNGLYKDPKSHLQEIVQEKFKITPSYKILDEWGPDHRKIFRTGVYFNEQLISEGEGYSKQESEVEAAKNALEETKELA